MCDYIVVVVENLRYCKELYVLDQKFLFYKFLGNLIFSVFENCFKVYEKY